MNLFRRDFLKGLAASAALALSALLPDLSGLAKRPHAIIRVFDPWAVIASRQGVDPAKLFVEHYQPKNREFLVPLDDDRAARRAITDAYGRIFNDRLMYGGAFYEIERVA